MSKKPEKTDFDTGAQNAALEIESIPGPPACLRIMNLMSSMPFPTHILQSVTITSDNPNIDIAEAGKYFIIYPLAQPLDEPGIGMLVYAESCVVREDKKRKKAPKHFVLSVIFFSRVRVLQVKRVKGKEADDEGSAREGTWESVEEESISEEGWGTEEFKSELEILKSRFHKLRMIMIQVLMQFAPMLVNSNRVLERGVILEDEFAKTSPDTYGSLLDDVCGYFFDFTKMLNGGGVHPEIAVDVKDIFIELNHIDRMEKLLAVLEYFTDDWQKIFQSGIYDRRGYESRLEAQPDIGGEAKRGNNDLAQRYDEIKDFLPAEVQRKVEYEFKRIMQSKAQEGSIESTVLNWLDWLLYLPWEVSTVDTENFLEVNRILDEDHFGLNKVKERICEYLAVRQNNPSMKSPILCLVGPPGVGKTSLGKSIARSLGRKFIRISLGGLQDEVEIRGHRRTYIEAMPGKIIQGIRRTGSMNPVFMLDEIDKVGRDLRDPEAALLEVLDPEQNYKFEDHYLNVPFDLSRVFFITTANTVDSIRPALRDRMEIIKISGYTPQEKLQIAKLYLVPKQKMENGFPRNAKDGNEVNIEFSEAAHLKSIYEYTSETGVRNLEREIAGVFRKVAHDIATEKILKGGIIQITEENLHIYCGKPKVPASELHLMLPVGVVPVLAVGNMGGHLFYAEAMKFERGNAERKVKVTGVRGSGEAKERINNLIEESIDNAFDSLTMEGGILYESPEDRRQNGEFYIHVHLRDSAVSKDGPSAGIPMFWLMYGLLTGQAVKPGVAATGEIGLVLSIIGTVGGIREKALAADRAGMKTLIIPEGNKSDVEDIPDEIRGRMVIKPTESKWNALLEAFPDDKGEKIREHIKKLQNS